MIDRMVKIVYTNLELNFSVEFNYFIILALRYRTAAIIRKLNCYQINFLFFMINSVGIETGTVFIGYRSQLVISHRTTTSWVLFESVDCLSSFYFTIVCLLLLVKGLS